jgi:hypothetical protein
MVPGVLAHASYSGSRDHQEDHSLRPVLSKNMRDPTGKIKQKMARG